MIINLEGYYSGCNATIYCNAVFRCELQQYCLLQILKVIIMYNELSMYVDCILSNWYNYINNKYTSLKYNANSNHSSINSLAIKTYFLHKLQKRFLCGCSVSALTQHLNKMNTNSADLNFCGALSEWVEMHAYVHVEMYFQLCRYNECLIVIICGIFKPWPIV